jgi:methyl-accepting chemotaxis protein
MAKKDTASMNAHVARLLAAGFATIILLGAVAAFCIGFAGALEREINDPVEAARRLSQALVWSQAAGVAALTLLAFVLFALAWYLRERLIAPLEKLRRSIAASASGTDEEIWGLSRRDEIGTLARAAENLRLCGENRRRRAGHTVAGDAAERLIATAERLEQQLTRIPEQAEQMRARVEEASLRAAKASHMAVEAAGLARDAAVRAGEDATRRSGAAPPDAAGTMEARPVMENIAARTNGEPSERMDATVVLDGLVANLDALERFASERKAIAEDEAVAFMASVIEAIDRLNSVADRICATADDSAVRAAQ